VVVVASIVGSRDTITGPADSLWDAHSPAQAKPLALTHP
jgi:hypothetical protein